MFFQVISDVFVGKNPQPPKRTAVTVEMDENENSTGNPKEWFAKTQTTV
jgi:hypothetical protein